MQNKTKDAFFSSLNTKEEIIGKNYFLLNYLPSFMYINLQLFFSLS